jgi:hypothetical protein
VAYIGRKMPSTAPQKSANARAASVANTSCLEKGIADLLLTHDPGKSQAFSDKFMRKN